MGTMPGLASDPTSCAFEGAATGAQAAAELLRPELVLVS